MSHIRQVKKKSNVTNKQKKRRTLDMLPLVLAPAMIFSLNTVSGVRLMLCVYEFLCESSDPLRRVSAATLICLSSCAIIFDLKICNSKSITHINKMQKQKIAQS